MKSKTVYILGAGFSVDAGAPTQAKIMSEIIRLHSSDPKNFNEEIFNTFQSFITEQLNIRQDRHAGVVLEDIFTPLDRCLSESSQFRGISLDKIMKVREAMFYVIGTAIKLVLKETNKSNDYIKLFANYLVKESKVREGKQYDREDPVSVISTNWDILLDNAIYENIVTNNNNAVVDYCCYISSKDKGDDSVKPGLEKLGQGGFNVKLLKLHGSLNWLQCPRCMRLYSQFFIKEGLAVFEEPSSCRHCDKNFPEEEGKHLLSSNLIMPSFIKDLSNPQYKVIWQNAGIEISEADRLVFIGYSLPNADFEMRQLLSRMTRRSATIEVVDYSRKAAEQQRIRDHWGNFFGDRVVEFNFKGAKKYINNFIKVNGQSFE